ncbi:UDP-N-acetylglucosamine 2-epimerase (non-hydrolyzing) [Candidatus Woesearchaeota archaeon]|nr:UDP-N-acetylglucosamine 2-epimerase (non-hydrolyzing) [Candidatus Woesearchaeota archaeon]
MNSLKICTVLGTRPEITKLSPLLPLLDQEFNHCIIHTGQHYDYALDGVFFKELHLPAPQYQLNIGSHSQGKQTGRMLEKIEEVLVQEQPGLVIVEGDTNTTMAGALAAAKLHIPVMHVESGCRSFNRKMPEEINRIVADHSAEYLIAPDEDSVKNLQQEGIPSQKVFLLGSTVFDAVERTKTFIQPEHVLSQWGLSKNGFILVTLHRAETTDNMEVITNIVQALNTLALNIPIVFPIHPRTRKTITENAITFNNNILSIDPQPYLSFLALLSACRFCITDSGGIQEEALAFNVPCLIPRTETEWVRLVRAGKNLLVGVKTEGILSAARKIIEDETELRKIKETRYPYDIGTSKKIIELIQTIDHDPSHR